MVVRADESDLKMVNDDLEAIWKDLFPTSPYSSHFQEDILLKNTKQLNGNLKRIFLLFFSRLRAKPLVTVSFRKVCHVQLASIVRSKNFSI